MIISDIFKCQYCEKEYSKKNSLNAHLSRYCKIKKQQEKNNDLEQKINQIKSELEEKQKKEKEEMKEHFEKKIKDLENKFKPQQQNIQQQNINNGNITNITINSYGCEDTSKLTKQIIYQIATSEQHMIPNYLKFLHITTEENRNIYLPNHKDGKIMVFDGNKWRLHDKNEFIEKLFIDGNTNMEKYIDDNDDKFEESEVKRSKALIDHSFEDPDEKKMVKNNITTVFAENASLIKETYEKNYNKKLKL